MGENVSPQSFLASKYLHKRSDNSIGKRPTSVSAFSFLSCALSANLDGSQDASIACIKHGPCQDLLQRLKNYDLSDEQVNPFEDIQNEDVEMEDRTELQIDEDEDVLIDI